MRNFSFKIKLMTMLLIAVALLSSCASTTLIDSYPSGANLYLNGEAVGQTPFEMTDTKPMFSCTSVRLEKENHNTFYTTICRNEEADVGAIIGGMFCTIPFVWAMKYKPTHFYRLRESDGSNSGHNNQNTDSEFEPLLNE